MIKEISKIDKNFKVETKIQKSDIRFLDTQSECFKTYGVMCTNGCYHRLPYNVAEATSEGVKTLNRHTAGGRIRFKTDSAYVAINAKIDSFQGKMPHFTTVGASGFDMYIVENGEAIYFRSFMPTYNFENGFEQIIEFPDNSMRDIIIHMPLYNICENLYIGIQESANIYCGSEYKNTKPIVFYGSSITQGGCASRPGNAYENIVSRKFDSDFINLGFSGNARGEDSISEYIANLDMSIFVYDYDHNAPTSEHLEKTHEKLFKRFRESNANIPVIIMSKTDIPRTPLALEDTLKRRGIVKKTYDNAIALGDKNVYFIDGQEIFKIAGGADCTVDGCHPNDLGFYCMAQAVIKTICDNNLIP